MFVIAKKANEDREWSRSGCCGDRPDHIALRELWKLELTAGKATQCLGRNRLFCGPLEEKEAEGKADRQWRTGKGNIENLSKIVSGCSGHSSKLGVCGFWLLRLMNRQWFGVTRKLTSWLRLKNQLWLTRDQQHRGEIFLATFSSENTMKLWSQQRLHLKLEAEISNV